MKRNIEKLDLTLIYIFIFSIIYQSGSVIAALKGTGLFFQVTRLSMLIIPIYYLYKYRNRKYYLFLFVGAIFSVFFVLINLILYPNGVIQLAYKLVILMLSAIMFMIFKKKNTDIREYFYNCVLAIAFITLIFYVFADLLKLPLPYKYIYNGSGYYYRSFFGVFYTYHYNFLIPRLSGLFWEPGAYQIYLNIALFYYIFNKKSNVFQYLILILSIILTRSTTGYCIACLLIAYQVIYSDYISEKLRKKIIIYATTSAVLLIVIILAIKIITTSGDKGSFTLRIADISNGLKIFIKNPIFGTGFNNDGPFIAIDTFGRGSSNGFISYLYMTGIIGLVVVFFPFIINIKNNPNKRKPIVWFVLFILFNSTEPFYNLPLMGFFLGVEYALLFNWAFRRLKSERKN